MNPTKTSITTSPESVIESETHHSLRTNFGHIQLTRNRRVIVCGVMLSILLIGCGKTPEGNVSSVKPETPPATGGLTAAQIIERYRALDNSRDSTIKMRAQIKDLAGGDSAAARQLQMNMYRKHGSDGRVLFLVEFTAPAEERDRDGLITVFPDDRIEAVRYVQSTDSFIVSTDAISEDALFGLTTQELADGQPEKYDFTIAGEETFAGAQVYRLDGKLKQHAESKFPRLVLLISKQTFAVSEAEFYDNHSEVARRLTINAGQQIAGHWTRTRWMIENRARRKTIDFEAVDVKYDQNLNDSLFTREHLKKIASR